MHKMLTALLLSATMAAPAMAQQDRGPADGRTRAEGDRGPRSDRPDRMDRRGEGRTPNMPVRTEPQVQIEQVGQRPDRDGQRQDRRDRRSDRFDGRNQGGPDRNGWDRGNPGRGDFDRNGPDRRGPDRDGRYDGVRGDRRDGQRDDRFDGRDPRGARPGRGNDGYGRNDYRWQGGSGTWNRDWRNDGRYDWQSYRQGNDRAFRAPRYYGPQSLGNGNGYGNSYRRWSHGYRIQPAFYGRNYWISRPELYRLPPAYGGYQWVRYYDDVALVDIRSGLIADILYSFFL